MLDYTKIKTRLQEGYGLEAFDKKGFEKSNLFSAKLDENAYVRAYVRYDMGMDAEETVNEDGSGVACATAGNTSGMGAVSAPQPASIPGVTSGSAYTNNGGTVGSGDAVAGNRNVRSRDVRPGRKRRKEKAQAAVKAMAKSAAASKSKSSTTFDPSKPTKPSGIIKSFSDYTKSK